MELHNEQALWVINASLMTLVVFCFALAVGWLVLGLLTQDFNAFMYWILNVGGAALFLVVKRIAVAWLAEHVFTYERTLARMTRRHS